MIVLYLLIGVVLLALVIGAIYFLVIKKKKDPLTSASIPPIPSQTEANQHFTPVAGAIVMPKKHNINKKVLIAIAVVFNIILIGTVIYIAKTVTKPKQIAANVPKPTPTSLPISPSPLPTPANIGIPVATPTIVIATSEPALSVSVSITPVIKATPILSVPNSSTLPLTSPTRSPSLSPSLSPSPKPTVSILSPTPTSIIVATAISPAVEFLSPTTVPEPTSTLNAVTALPETGTVLSYLAFIVPALLVAIAFVL